MKKKIHAKNTIGKYLANKSALQRIMDGLVSLKRKMKLVKR